MLISIISSASWTLLDFFRCKDALPVHPDVHLRVLRGVGVEWTNTVFWEERANPFTCIKWTTPSTASWNSFMLCFTYELFVWRLLMWVSIHITRSLVYMVSTTFPYTAMSMSWTMMLNNRGAITDPRGTPILTPLVVAQEGSDEVVHVVRNSDLVEFL